MTVSSQERGKVVKKKPGLGKIENYPSMSILRSNLTRQDPVVHLALGVRETASLASAVTIVFLSSNNCFSSFLLNCFQYVSRFIWRSLCCKSIKPKTMSQTSLSAVKRWSIMEPIRRKTTIKYMQSPRSSIHDISFAESYNGTFCTFISKPTLHRTLA